jgi:uncharacterized membrane protein YsdA (DUF1294 family)
VSVEPWTLVLATYAVASAVTFAAFARDKRAASRGQRRTSEATLHFLELFGGFPGALLAMVLMRHKSRKPAYVGVVIVIALMHAAAWSLWFTG